MKEIKLAEETIDKKDISALIEWLQTEPQLTKGPLTQEFEQKWSQWLGVKYSVFVNSGSSANLIALYSLITTGQLKNKKNNSSCRILGYHCFSRHPIWTYPVSL